MEMESREVQMETAMETETAIGMDIGLLLACLRCVLDFCLRVSRFIVTKLVVTIASS